MKKDMPAKKSDDAIGDELHDWIGKDVRVVSEKAGPLKYGRLQHGRNPEHTGPFSISQGHHCKACCKQ